MSTVWYGFDGRTYTNEDGIVRGNFWHALTMRDPSAGDAFSLKPFLYNTAKIYTAGGRYTFWPEWKEDVNAREWNHFCYVISVKNRNFAVVHNGYTQANHTQPTIWATNDTFVTSDFFQSLNQDGATPPREGYS